MLEKILCNHPRISILSQPFPFLFTHAKKAFFSSIQYPPVYYPLNNYFNEERYRPPDLYRFLSRLTVTPPQLTALFREMEDFSGQYTKFDPASDKLANLSEGVFIDIYKDLVQRLRHRDAALYCGSKETHCEEFFPFFANNRVKCIAIIRDPRDVIASFNYGKGTQYGGQVRPTLFHVRNWRKSVAFALKLNAHPNFMAVKYEDLILRTPETLDNITRFLAVEAFEKDSINGPLRDQQGRPWAGNSSHETVTAISPASIGKYKSLLPPRMLQYIEITCAPEMNYYHYPLQNPDAAHSDEASAASVLESFQEPIPVTRPEFEPRYSADPRSIRHEVRRLDLLRRFDPDPGQVYPYFIFPEVYQILKRRGN